MYCPDGDRHEGDVNRHRLLCGTWEPSTPMLREKPKRRPRKGESTDADSRGGTARTSEEASVMGVEQRGGVISFCELVNQ